MNQELRSFLPYSLEDRTWIALEKIKRISGEIAQSDNSGLEQSINSESSEYSLKYAPANLIEPLIENAATVREEEIASQKKRDKIHVMLDFSFLRTYMEKVGLVLQKVKCSECGAPVLLPPSEGTTICKHCGRTVLAQDIYEKIKDLV